MVRKQKQILSLVLAVLLAVGSIAASAPTVYAAQPTPGVGDASDGVDMDALFTAGNYIYYGTYDHATALDPLKESGAYGVVTARENKYTPVKWRVMGEEAGDNAVTLLSEYVLDSTKFRSDNKQLNSGVYDASDIKTFLANMNLFSAAENIHTVTTAVTTKMFDYGNVYNPGVREEKIGEYFGAVYPVTSSGHILYLPWGKYQLKVYWTADAGNENAISQDIQNVATLKNSTPVYWWLRSPSDSRSGGAYAVDNGGWVGDFGTTRVYGVRPAFKLNPSSVVFASEIKSGADSSKGETLADSNYAAGSAKNFKLTVMGFGGSLVGVPAIAQTIIPGNDLTLIDLTPSHTGSDYTVNYKIVGSGSGERKIVRYGSTAATSATSLTLDTDSLVEGSYDAYVWLQKNNAINSHEAMAIQHIPIKVTNVTVSSVTVKNAPTKTTYTEGELLDLTGLVVTVNKSDGSTEDVTLTDFASRGIAVSPTNGTMMSVDSHNGNPVTVSCGGQTANTGNLTVNAAPVISATISPTSLNYDLASPSDVSTTITWGGTTAVTGVVYGATPLAISTDYTVSGNVLTIKDSYLASQGFTAGDTAVFTISFDKGNSATLTVSIVTVSSVTVKNAPTKTTYTEGEFLDLTDLVVTVNKSDGSTEDVTLTDFASRGITVSPANGTMMSVATHNGKPVTVSCYGQTANTGNLTVNALP